MSMDFLYDLISPRKLSEAQNQWKLLILTLLKVCMYTMNIICIDEIEGMRERGREEERKRALREAERERQT